MIPLLLFFVSPTLAAFGRSTTSAIGKEPFLPPHGSKHSVKLLAKEPLFALKHVSQMWSWWMAPGLMKGTSSLVDCLSVMTTMDGIMPWSCAGFITGRRRQRKIQLGKTSLPFSFCQDAWILRWAPYYWFNVWKSQRHLQNGWCKVFRHRRITSRLPTCQHHKGKLWI